LFCSLAWPVSAGSSGRDTASSTVTFDQAMSDLKSTDVSIRYKAVQLLEDAAYPEAAVPLAAALTDPSNEVQMEAIGAELNIFLADKVNTRKRMGLVVEIRNKVDAEAVFNAGRLALGTRPVPMDVLAGLCRAMHDETARVGLSAMYAFGALGSEPAGDARREVLRLAAPELAGMLGVPDSSQRLATLRVIARVFERRAGDSSADEGLGDAIIGALNDRNVTLRTAAMQSLGAMRYERGVQGLTQLYQYFGHGSAAEAALDALARISSPASTPLFVAQLKGKDPAMKIIAIEGLARSGDRGRAADVQTAVSERDSDAITLASRFSDAFLTNSSIDLIIDQLARPKLHDQAFGYLLELAPGRSSMFVKGAKDPDAKLRSDVADILGLAGDPAAMALVEPMKQDRDPQVVRAAETASARLLAMR